MKLKELKQQIGTFIKHALLASYTVVYGTAKSKKPQIITEEMILLAAVDIVNTIAGEAGGELLSKYLYPPILVAVSKKRLRSITLNITYLVYAALPTHPPQK